MTPCEHRPPSGRPPRWIGWSVCALILGTSACSRSVPEPPPRQLPLRLFQVESVEPEPILESAFRTGAGFEQWWLLGSGARAGLLQPAAEQLLPGRDGQLPLLPEGRPLFRLFEAPPGTPLKLELELGEDLSGSPGDTTTSLQCFSLGALKWTGSPEDVLTSRSIGMPSGGSRPLEGLLAFRLRAIQESSDARIETPRQIVLLMAAPREPELRVVVLRAEGGARAARSLRVLLDHSRGEEARNRRPHREVVAGEERILIRLAAGATHEVTEILPRGIRRLSFGVAVDPLEPPVSTPLPFTVKAERDGQAILTHRGRVEAHDLTEQAFEDVHLSWPEDSSPAANAAVHLSFSNDGDRAMLFTQPILRGPAGSRQPNLLLISLDTLRADHLSGSAYPRPTSPFLDRFRQQSASFEQFLAVASHTLPAHVSMLTGLLPIQHQVHDKTHRLEARSIVYLPALLAESGYLTAAFTGGGFVSSAFGFSHGFDRFVMADPLTPADGLGLPPKRAQPGRRSLDDVARWIEERRDESWFAFVHTYAIHN
ncbi:MAG: sulfatase-like hydrolase/transferase, partial [Planctomycetota bacterium]